MANVRLQDVAELAGVSMKTVSNVVHEYPHVSAKMRERVQRAIDELGYRPNMLGRRLATGRTGLIALAFADVTLPYFAELARRVASLAEEQGYRVIIEETDNTLEGERAVVATSEAGHVDGMIFQPAKMSSAELSQTRTDLPLVILGEGAAPLTIDRVMIDNVAAAREATAHLVSLGRTRIAFAGHELDQLSRTSELRIAGYQAALEEAGLTVAPELLIPSAAISPIDSAVSVGAALDAGLDVDAIMCRDDLAAIGALRALQERGRRVPDEVAITGWDNTMMTSVTFPSITTVSPDMTALASRALTMLRERIDGLDSMGRHELVGFELVKRESAPAS
ncbi:LacI family DNA-binding transcriptional regulator [Leifsonia sp. NPDC058292]|uniref:LacI family DNA-binding transcriptional regulator n=1 Tax=Leifsonia sp. NPDC058292 TaxID=3346428 RepID=UPI0036D97B64